MKTTVNNATKLARKINEAYVALSGDDMNFFNQYHDSLRIQADCAWDEVAELEEYLQNPTNKYGRRTGLECANMGMQNLVDTLKYCEAVIKLQEQTLKLPKSIYG